MIKFPHVLKIFVGYQINFIQTSYEFDIKPGKYY